MFLRVICNRTVKTKRKREKEIAPVSTVVSNNNKSKPLYTTALKLCFLFLWDTFILYSNK
jgi:hypothetical protein